MWFIMINVHCNGGMSQKSTEGPENMYKAEIRASSKISSKKSSDSYFSNFEQSPVLIVKVGM